MVDAISSNQMVQQAMKMRGFGRRHGGDGTTAPEGGWQGGGWGGRMGPPDDGTSDTDRVSRMQAFASKYGRSMPEGLTAGQGFQGFKPGLNGGEGPRLSFADGKSRGPGRHAGLKDNPQMAAAMEALKQVLDQAQGASEEDRQTQLVNWATAYNVPIPEAGSKWFWEA